MWVLPSRVQEAYPRRVQPVITSRLLKLIAYNNIQRFTGAWTGDTREGRIPATVQGDKASHTGTE
jgi:hypothetical protein